MRVQLCSTTVWPLGTLVGASDSRDDAHIRRSLRESFLGLGAFELTPSPFPGSDVDFPDMRDHSRIALGILDLFRGGKPLLPH